ncbi:RE1, partial [Symbiodinium necroappetens]
ALQTGEASLVDEEELVKNPEGLKDLVQHLRDPVEQGLQKMILAINAKFPVKDHQNCQCTSGRSLLDGQLRQILNRWIEARYAAPHSSIPEGHVLVTREGNLVELDEEASVQEEDFRNEWGSLNHVFAVPGAVELWRNPHAVRKHSDWILVAYTPLGSAKLGEEDWARLRQCHQAQDRVARQKDSYTTTIGWDVTNGPGDYPRLSQHGVEEPSDLPFLYEEDLLEMGIPTQVGARGRWDVPEEIGADPTDSPRLPVMLQLARAPAQLQAVHSSRSVLIMSAGQSGLVVLVTAVSAGQSGPLRIGVPLDDPLTALGSTKIPDSATRVSRVEEAMYTPNVERLLESLTSPLEVIHNVAPAEVREHLERWRQAAETEVKSLETLGAIRRLKGREARELLRDGTVETVPAKAVCTIKPGAPYKRKMRVVSCGNYATGTDEASLYAGGAGAESLRALLVHGGRRGRRCFCTDIKTAFLLAPIPAHVSRRYAVKPPRVLIELNICDPSEIWLIQKALYGFRESPKWWAIHRDSVLETAQWSSGGEHFHLQQLRSESNIWAIVSSSGACAGHLLIYVDDLLLVTEEFIACDFVKWIKARWDCTELSTATEDSPLKFLGVDIYEVRDKHGLVGFRLGQEGYIDELLRSHDVVASARATTPVPKDWVREAPEAEQFSQAELRSAQRITGELLWVAQRTRLDLGFCVGLMSSWTTKAPSHVSKIGMRVLQFLAATKTQRLSLVPGRANGLSMYSDASFAPYGDHSISGILLQYDEVGVVWKSRKQTLVTLSTAEAELVAACDAVVLGQSLAALVDELEGTSTSKRLLVDNDMQARGELIVEHCPGEVQLAVAQVLANPVESPLEPVANDREPEQPAVPMQARVGLVLVLLLLQAELGEATSPVSEDLTEPLGVELSLLLVMMTLAMLFVWESSKQCVRACCTRRLDGEYGVRAVTADDSNDEPSSRRGRRQQAVRRAIEREVQDEGLRL